ncbi:Sec-independent protein translocase subunit TatA/TatB [Natronomonas sp.]|uniref:Sec-independent protein translocase subunit TatA/TatB n=1 Tax=Natronomonas sp. TaxID=2184060 RepID=UPI002606C0E7|nr:twin-arginine translocase TatA/TatE family subunit [Natronomonas sp.]
MDLPLFVGGLGPPELLLIAGVLILLFGASKLPKLARSMGSATGEFKKGREQVEEELEDLKEGDEVDREPDAEIDADAESDAEIANDGDIETERTGA